MADLDLLDIGMVLDMFVENANDSYYSGPKEPEIRDATAEDIAAW